MLIVRQLSQRLLRHRRRALAVLTGVLVVVVLTLRSSSDDPADAARATLVDAAGLTADQARCVLDSAAARGVDIEVLRQLIVDPGADAELTQEDQRRVNEAASDCLGG